MTPIDWMDARSAARGSAEPAQEPAVLEPILLEGLNEPQRTAVTLGEGPLLILAGAGSGKTRVITRRIAWLVATGRAAPHEVLAITFTNKAAREMRERVGALMPVRGMWIGTFHATCARVLRREIEVLGGWTRDYSIYDTHDRNHLLKSIVKELGFDPQRFRPASLGAAISDHKNRRFGRAEVDEEGGIEDEVLARVRARYEEAMRENNALDFDDLLLLSLELFERHPGVRDLYAARFRHVLVDEYQDTNHVQYLLVRHLSSAHGNVAVCGDPDQSIYAWRGADIDNILDFESDFAGRAGRATVVKLEQNYRSTPRILRAAQALIRHNIGRKEKDLWSERPEGELPCAIACGDEEDEANEIARRIHALRAQGTTFDRIAVFYRVNFMQRALERSLRLAGIPYQIVGGVEFYQRREIRDLIGYLQLLANPRDDVACRRVLNVPARGVGEKSVERLAAWAADRRVSLREAVASTEARALLRGRSRRGVEAFAELLERLAGAVDGPAAAALERVIAETDYFSWLASGADPDFSAREENVEELRTHAATYDAESPEGGLRGFLQEVALVSDVDAFDEAAARVTLMTLHASKGLEFPVVFVAGLEEGLLPHSLAVVDGGDEGVEEERRLLYVGMTRAQERLFLTHAETRMHYGETSWRTPSRFLAEVPGDLIEGGEDSAAREELGSYESPPEVAELREGDRVEHDHFGRGRIVRLQGAGINARATVAFDHAGERVLLVQYARLEVVGR